MQLYAVVCHVLSSLVVTTSRTIVTPEEVSNHRNAIAQCATEQAVHRHSCNLTLDIETSDLDSTIEASVRHVVDTTQDLHLDSLQVEWVQTDNSWLELHQCSLSVTATALTQTYDTFIGENLHDVAEKITRVNTRVMAKLCIHWNGNHANSHVSNFHKNFLLKWV